MDKAVAGLIWLSGLSTTSLFFWQLGMDIYAFPVAIVMQAALTRLQSPIWLYRIKSPVAAMMGVVALILDVMFNAAGIYESILLFNETDLGEMLVSQGVPTVDGIGFLFIAILIGMFQAGAPEILWSLSGGNNNKR